MEAAQRRAAGSPAWHPATRFYDFLEIEGVTGTLFLAEPKGVTGPEELSDFVTNLLLGGPSPHGVRAPARWHRWSP